MQPIQPPYRESFGGPPPPPGGLVPLDPSQSVIERDDRSTHIGLVAAVLPCLILIGWFAIGLQTEVTERGQWGSENWAWSMVTGVGFSAILGLPIFFLVRTAARRRGPFWIVGALLFSTAVYLGSFVLGFILAWMVQSTRAPSDCG